MNREELFDQYRSMILVLPERSSESEIERVAIDLERYTHEPLFLFSIPGFLRMTKPAILDYLESLQSLDEATIQSANIHIPGGPDKILEHQLRMVVRNYRLLLRLRADDPLAWDEIHELYEDD